jgi:hypothetical protein
MKSKTLYNYRDSEIHINIVAYFEGEYLVIDGCDRGEKVKAYWGDSDYEYLVKIPPEGVRMLRIECACEHTDQDVFLDHLAARYASASCYSDIRDLMERNNIPCEGFTWI